MIKKKVLIAFGSRFGSTEEISQKIANTLEKEGINTTILDLRKMKIQHYPLLQEYDGVLVGSGIKMGRWTKETKTFMTKNREIIRRTKRKGVFISSGWVSFPSKREQAKKDYLDKVVSTLEIEMDLSEAFGGVFDLSKSSRMGFWDKKIIKKVIESEIDTAAVSDHFKNDFRDWDQIREFAKEFAALVQNS